MTTTFGIAQTVVISDNSTYSGNTSSLLDIHSTNGDLGLLIPQVDLTRETDVSTISSPANGLIVFNKGPTLTKESIFGLQVKANGNIPIAVMFLLFRVM